MYKTSKAYKTMNCLRGFTDDDWAEDVMTRKSTSGYVFQIGTSTISWKSKLRSIVALSSTEAEYISLSSATQEAVWFLELLCVSVCILNKKLGKNQLPLSLSLIHI